MSTTSTPQPATTSAQTIPHGRFVWYDLMTSDPDAAQQFYTRIAGWGTQPWGDPGSYTMWTNGGAPLGGTVRLPDELIAQGIPPHWLAYVCVRNVDETIREAEKLGGKAMHQPEDIPSVGRFAVLADPQGAALAIFTPAEEPPGHAGEPRLGEFSWHELMTTDYVAAFDFYKTLFGWEKISDFDMGEMGMYHMFGQHVTVDGGLHGFPYGGMFNKTPDMPMPPNWMCYIQVSNVDETVALVKELGGQILNGPMEVPGGDMIAQCLDPQGAAFAVHQRKA